MPPKKGKSGEAPPASPAADAAALADVDGSASSSAPSASPAADVAACAHADGSASSSAPTPSASPALAADAAARLESEKRAIVEDVRSKFLASQFLADQVQNAAARIAHDLYSGCHHFIYEVIQNAEDNAYSEGKKPCLLFKLWKDKSNPDGILAIINNETGFEKKDVLAICSIGDSTKKDRKADGFIGEKGLGFKSVFVVSRTPQIFSNGFRFALDEERDPLLQFGFIVPKWIEAGNVPEIVRQNRDQTVILLPLKPGKYESVATGLAALRPELFLGLTKLERIDVDVQGRETLSTSCDRSGPPFLVLSTRRGAAAAETTRIFVHDEVIDIPAGLVEKERQGVTKRPFRVALGLSSDGIKSLFGQVYAYLPTKIESGLPFAINADWILVASREEMHDPEQRPWNAWILKTIPNVFVRGFLRLLKHADEGCRAYASVPLAGSGRFKKVHEAIVEKLRGTACVLCEGGSLRPPRAALIPPPGLYGLLKGKATPAGFVEKPLVAEQVVAEGKAAMAALRSLGVGSVGDRQYLAWLGDATWLAQRDAQWHLALYKFLMADCKGWAWRAVLEPLNLIPSTQSTPPVQGQGRPFVCTRPADGTTGLAQLQAVEACGAVSSVLPVAHPLQDILDAMAKDAELKGWLEGALGLQPFTFSAWVEKLAPLLQKRAHDGTLQTAEQFVAPVAFIRRCWAEYPDSFPFSTCRTLASSLPLIEEPVAYFTCGDREISMIYLPANAVGSSPPFGDAKFVADWPAVLPEAADRAGLLIISPAYVSSSPSQDAGPAWREFFCEVLGIPRVPSYPFELVQADAQGAAPSIQQAIGYDLGRMLSAKYNRIDVRQPWVPTWVSAASRRLAGSAFDKNYEARVTALFNWLQASRLTERDLSRTQIEYEWIPQSKLHKGSAEFGSTLWHALGNFCWFPTTKGLHKPSSAYLLEDSEIVGLLGAQRPCAVFDVPRNLRWGLGFKTAESASVYEEVRQWLLGMARSDRLDDAALETLKKIYGFLHRRAGSYMYSTCDVRILFETQNLIYVPQDQCWLTSSDVTWPGADDGAGNPLPALADAYPTLKAFFVDKLGVKEHLDDRFFADRWSRLSQKPVPEDREARAALERQLVPCYRRMAALAQLEAGKRPHWWAGWVHGASVYTGDAFVHARDRGQVLLPDCEPVEKLFAGDVQLAWLPGGALRSFWALFAAFDLQPISHAVRRTVGGGACAPLARRAPNSKLTRELRECLCRMLFSDLPDVYAKAKADGHLERLLRAVERPAAALDVQYELRGVVRAVPECVACCDWSADGGGACALWWRAGKAPAVVAYALAREVAALMNRSVGCRETERRMQDALESLFTAGEEVRDLKAREHRWALPEEERAWVAAVLDEAEGALGAGRDGDDDRGSEEAGGTIARKRRRGAAGEEEGDDGDGRPAPKRPRAYASKAAAGFAEAQEEEEEEAPGPAERAALREAAVRLALAYEDGCGRPARPAESQSEALPACDVESCAAAGGPVARRIEVRALRGAWGFPGVALDQAQAKLALLRGDDYWLYVVEHAGDPSRRRLHALRNPVRVRTLNAGASRGKGEGGGAQAPSGAPRPRPLALALVPPDAPPQAMTHVHIDGRWRRFAADSFRLAPPALPALSP